MLEEYLRRFDGFEMDTLILGCTHYPLLKPIIQDLLGPGIALIDSGAATAAYVRELLAKQGLLSGRESGGAARYYISEHTETFAETAKIFLGHGIEAEYAVAEVPLEETPV